MDVNNIETAAMNAIREMNRGASRSRIRQSLMDDGFPDALINEVLSKAE